jgi:hypothetical protein
MSRCTLYFAHLEAYLTRGRRRSGRRRTAAGRRCGAAVHHSQSLAPLSVDATTRASWPTCSTSSLFTHIDRIKAHHLLAHDQAVVHVAAVVRRIALPRRRSGGRGGLGRGAIADGHERLSAGAVGRGAIAEGGVGREPEHGVT